MITLYTGVMFTGKTKALILKYNELRDQGKKCLMIKPSIDQRFSNYEVVSRSGYRVLADMLISKDEVSCLLSAIKNKNPHSVFFDEAQFLEDDLMYLIDDLARVNIDVYLAGLTRDSDNKPFGCLGRVSMLNGVINKRMNVECSYTGCTNEAKRSFCLIDKSESVLVGDTVYAPRCDSHLIKDKEHE